MKVTALQPGPVASHIGTNNSGIAYRLAGPLIKRLFPSADRAARTALILATAPELAEATGGYYRSRKRRTSPLPCEPATSERLWRWSADRAQVDLEP